MIECGLWRIWSRFGKLFLGYCGGCGPWLGDEGEKKILFCGSYLVWCRAPVDVSQVARFYVSTTVRRLVLLKAISTGMERVKVYR